jgi:hypothetical protein
VRVDTVPHRGLDAGELLVRGRSGDQRLAKLPGSTSVAAYAVPVAALADPGTRLELALPNRATLPLRWTDVAGQGGQRGLSAAAAVPMR